MDRQIDSIDKNKQITNKKFHSDRSSSEQTLHFNLMEERNSLLVLFQIEESTQIKLVFPPVSSPIIDLQ